MYIYIHISMYTQVYIYTHDYVVIDILVKYLTITDTM